MGFLKESWLGGIRSAWVVSAAYLTKKDLMSNHKKDAHIEFSFPPVSVTMEETQSVTFNNCDLRKTHFNDVGWERGIAGRFCDFQGARFDGCYLVNSDFSFSDFRDSNFSPDCFMHGCSYNGVLVKASEAEKYDGVDITFVFVDGPPHDLEEWKPRI